MDSTRPISESTRPRGDVPSPTAGSVLTDTVVAPLLVFASLGMGFLFGGTVFWASGAFFAIGLVAVFGLQIAALRGPRPLRLCPPLGTTVWGGLLLYVLARAVFVPVIPYQAWTEAMQMGAVLLFYVAFSDLCNRRAAWKWVLGAFLLAASAQALYGISLQLQNSNSVLWLTRPAQYRMRASGTFICPNHYAQILQVAILLGLGLLFTPRTGITLKLFSGFTVLASLYPIFLSGSRAAWIGLVAGITMLVAGKAMRRGVKSTLMALTALTVACTGVYAALWRFSPLFRNRVQHALRGDIRWTQLWPDTWRMIQQEGFWGAGPGMFRHVFEQYRFHFDRPTLFLRHAHNEYLHMIADYGWPGLLILLAGMCAVAWVLVRVTLRSERESDAMIPLTMLSIFAAVAVHAVFDFNAHIPGVMTQVVLVLGALHGHGLRRGVWKARPLHPLVGKTFVWLALLLAPVTAMGFLVLARGSWAEFEMERARLQDDHSTEQRQAAIMRRWTPFHWRGWTELGFHHRMEAEFTLNRELRARHIELSREAYQTALRWNPYERIALIGLAQLSVLERDHEAALSLFGDLLNLDPFDVHVHVQYGLALERVGRFHEALEIFEKADRMRRRDPQIQLNLRHLRQKIREMESNSTHDASR